MALELLTFLDWTDKLEFLSKVKDKLINNKDAAAEKLAGVFLELTKIFQAIDQELIEYLALNFTENEDNSDEIKTLLRFEGAQISMRIDEARGHCHKIWNIYERYLRGWFSKILDPVEQSGMEDLFRELGGSDTSMIEIMRDLEKWLSEKAQETLDLAYANDIKAANEKIKEARLTLRPTRNIIKENINQLQSLYNDFIEVTGAV